MTDPWPCDEVIRAGNSELVAMVRGRLPDRYYGGETWWSLVRSAALTRMADTVEAAMALAAADLEQDGRTIVRSLYEQAVTFAWIAADPETRLTRWRNDAIAAQLRLHNDAVGFDMSVLTDEQVVADKQRLDWRKRDGWRQAGPDPERVLPSLDTRAQQADEYWAERIEGLHAVDHPLGFRGLYVGVYRVGSRTTHGSMSVLDQYLTEQPNRYDVHRAKPDSRLLFALVAPIFGITMTIAAQQMKGVDEQRVREIVDEVT